MSLEKLRIIRTIKMQASSNIYHEMRASSNIFDENACFFQYLWWKCKLHSISMTKMQAYSNIHDEMRASSNIYHENESFIKYLWWKWKLLPITMMKTFDMTSRWVMTFVIPMIVFTASLKKCSTKGKSRCSFAVSINNEWFD